MMAVLTVLLGKVTVKVDADELISEPKARSATTLLDRVEL
jgi:hypothetical protein